MAPYEAPYVSLYGQKCRSPIDWFELSEAQFLGQDSVQQAIDKVKLIRYRVQIAQSRHKSYVDVCRRALKFAVDNWVFLKVSPIKGII